jgi:hypothetical protein
VYEKTGDIKAVVDHLIAESREGVLTDDAAPGMAVPNKALL